MTAVDPSSTSTSVASVADQDACLRDCHEIPAAARANKGVVEEAARGTDRERLRRHAEGGRGAAGRVDRAPVGDGVAIGKGWQPFGSSSPLSSACAGEVVTATASQAATRTGAILEVVMPRSVTAHPAPTRGHPLPMFVQRLPSSEASEESPGPRSADPRCHRAERDETRYRSPSTRIEPPASPPLAASQPCRRRAPVEFPSCLQLATSTGAFATGPDAPRDDARRESRGGARAGRLQIPYRAVGGRSDDEDRGKD